MSAGTDIKAGKFNKSHLMEMFDLNQPQLQKILDEEGDAVPVGKNRFDKRLVYTDETVEYFEEVLGLPKVGGQGKPKKG